MEFGPPKILFSLAALDEELSKIENLIRSGGDTPTGPSPELINQRVNLSNQRAQMLDQAEQEGLRDPYASQMVQEAITQSQNLLSFIPDTPLNKQQASLQEARFGIPKAVSMAPEPKPEQKPLLPGESMAPRIVGGLAPYFAAGELTAPVAAGVTELAAARGAGPLLSNVIGQTAQELAFLPSTLATTESPEEAAGYSFAGIALGSILARLGGKQVTEKVVENMTSFKPSLADLPNLNSTPEMTSKTLAEAGVDPKNMEALDIVNQTVPYNQWLPVLGEHLADGDVKALEAYGQKVRLKNSSGFETVYSESNDVVAEVLTADGPISTQAALADKTQKVFLDMGMQPSLTSILDQVRPSASLAERKYLLLNADIETFRNVSTRFKTPQRVQERIIQKAKALSPDKQGQFLFNSVVEQAQIASNRGDVDVFQVPRKRDDFERFQALKFTQDELNSKFYTMDEAIREANAGYLNPEAINAMGESLSKSFETDLLKQQRLQTLDSIKDMIARGDTETADLLLEQHVNAGKLISIGEKVKSDLGSIGLEGTIGRNLARQYAKAPSIAKLHGTQEKLPWLGIHFPELNTFALKYNQNQRRSIVLASIKDTNKEDALGKLLSHEYGHDFDEFLVSAASIGNEEAKAFKAALDEATYVHDPRMWDPISEGVADLQNTHWPAKIEERVDLPPRYSAAHHKDPKEIRADIIALLSTPEGRESLNPLVRDKLEPFVGKIKEPYAPKYVIPREKADLYSRHAQAIKSGFIDKGRVPAHNTVKNGGKVLTTPTQEAQIQLMAINAATDPNTGATPKAAQEIINNSGPAASMGFEQLIDGSGPFNKSKVLKNLDKSGAKDKITLKDYIRALLEVRNSAMLTGPATQIANGLSDLWRSIEQVGITAGAATIDIAKYATRIQKERQVYFGEIPAQIYGQFSELFGLHSALPANLRQFANEIRRSKDYVGGGAIGKLVSAIPNQTLKKAGTVVATGVEVPFNMLTATDTFFFDVNFAGSIHRQAYAKSIKEGKNFIQALGEITEQVGKYDARARGIQNEAIAHAEKAIDINFPGDTKEEITKLAKQYKMENIPVDIEEAKLAAERSIFVAKEGKKADWLLDQADKIEAEMPGVISGALPFRRTPAYIVREGLRSSPVGLMTFLAEILGKGFVANLGTREASNRLGQALFGTAAFYVLYQNIKNGNIQGDPENFDPNKSHRDTYNAAGRRPATLRMKMFGNTYTFPLDRIQPLGATLQTMLQYKKDQDAADAQGIPQDSLHEQGAQIAWDLTRNLGFGDFSRNLADLFDAINSTEDVGKSTAGKRYLASLGASFVPAVVRQVRAGLGEPYKRPEESSYLGAPIAGFKASLGYGEDRIGLFGSTERTNKPANEVLGVAFGGALGQEKNDPVVNKMIEVGAYHQSPELIDELKEVETKQQVAFQVGKGKLQRQYVERVVLNPGFAGLNPEAQKRLIDKAFAEASKLANKRAKTIIKLKGIINENVIFRGKL